MKRGMMVMMKMMMMKMMMMKIMKKRRRTKKWRRHEQRDTTGSTIDVGNMDYDGRLFMTARCCLGGVSNGGLQSGDIGNAI